MSSSPSPFVLPMTQSYFDTPLISLGIKPKLHWYFEHPSHLSKTETGYRKAKKSAENLFQNSTINLFGSKFVVLIYSLPFIYTCYFETLYNNFVCE